MLYRNIADTGISVSALALGTWSFGNDRWWGHQDDQRSYEALDAALASGINLIDTAPVYGRGKSEEVIGSFIVGHKLRDKVIIATKLGLNWDKHGPKIFHDLTPIRMRQELDDSRKRLQTDYFDLYQVHWPDKNVPIASTAELMREFYEKKVIRAVGVSNYSVEQMQEFMRYCPLHSLQPQYSMFHRDIERETVDFCIKHNIAILAYAPLFSGILTGKFYFDNVAVPNDINRGYKSVHFKEPLLSLNKDCLSQLKEMAQKYGKTLGQLVLNWTMIQPGIVSVLAGSRSAQQLRDNLGSCGWVITREDMEMINILLRKREEKIKA